jgi:hypothetical protein
VTTFFSKQVVFSPQEFGQFLTVYSFYENVMLQLCENLSLKNSLEVSIVQKNLHKQWDWPGRVKPVGLEFLVKGFTNSGMGKRGGGATGKRVVLISQVFLVPSLSATNRQKTNSGGGLSGFSGLQVSLRRKQKNTKKHKKKRKKKKAVVGSVLSLVNSQG